MDLSRIGIEPRLRSPWEAVDLGFVMARQWYKPLLLCWLVPSLMVFIVFTAIFSDTLWLALLLTWWLKPLYDRAPLYFASRALFGETVSVRAAVRALPGQCRFEWLPWLTWRRLNITRSFDLPVTQLEQLPGAKRRARLQILHRYDSSAASWLTIVCVHLEALVSIGAVALAVLILPSEVDVDFVDLFISENSLILWVSHLLSFMAMVLIAPFYTLAGFALYISRRIELEAWDVEIRFRHLAARHLTAARVASHPKGSLKDSALGFVAVAILSICVLQPLPATAQDDTDTVLIENAQQSRELIEQVLTGDDFHNPVTQKGWRLKKPTPEDEEGPPEWFIKLIEYLEENGYFDDERSSSDSGLLWAKVLEFLLWGFAISLVAYFFYHYRDAIRRFIFEPEKSDSNEAPAEVLFGLDVREESLPEDIPTRIRQFCDRGEFRQALSLLYRATLSNLIHKRGFAFYDSHTEGECVAIVRQRGDGPLSDYTQDLTACWQRLAYGHHLPPAQKIDQLCERWQRLFANEN